jgi:N utilization substance protein B
MLNRRLIRIRAMQTLYAFEKAKGANFLLAQDLIAEAFAPDLNSMEKQDKKKLMGYQKLAQSIFFDEIQEFLKPEEQESPEEVKMVIIKAREYYKNKNKKDFDLVSSQCILDAEKVYDIYLYLLAAIIEVSSKFPTDSNFKKNKIVKALCESKELDHLAKRRSINWENDRIFINKLYNEALKTNAYICQYQEKVNITLEEDLAILKYLIKNILLKHEVCFEYFEKIHIFWEEDTDILRTMLSHTFMEFPETGQLNIETLDEVWEESKDFLKVLFKETVNEDKTLMKYLVPFLRNWELDRIVETDKILLKMALTELINFPSIPIKVTINEIIEISKNYSSKKSGQFLNGILDSLVKDLTAKGIIKKSGRGMIDNK